MKREYRSFRCCHGSYERPSSLSSSFLSQQYNFGLAERQPAARIASDQSWIGRLVHSDPGSASAWNLHTVAAGCADGGGTGARRRPTEQIKGRHGCEVCRDAARGSRAICSMVEASIVLGEKGAKAEAPPRLGTALLGVHDSGTGMI